jgi:hypothetical protein
MAGLLGACVPPAPPVTQPARGDVAAALDTVAAAESAWVAPDTVRRDSVALRARRDTLARDTTRRDSTRRDSTRRDSTRRETPEAAARGAATDSAARARRTPVDVATAQRFEIVAIGDSTFVFLASRAPWLRAGGYGIAVDPRRRDVLVARFDVVDRHADSATALVTGQTQRVTVEHVALVTRPADTVSVTVLAPVRRTRFWEGVLAGLGVGILGTLLAR